MARHTSIKTTIGNQAASTLLAAAAATTSSTLAGLQPHNRTINLTDSTKWSSTESCELTDNEHYNNDENHDQLYVKLSTFWYCFLAFITAVGLFVSLVSNMIIIYLFTGTPSLRRNPSNIIAVNLSLSDLLYCIQWPSVIYCSLSQSTWLLEIDFVCKTFGFITVTTGSASVLTVLAMSVERAIVIKYSIYAKSRYTIRNAWLIVVLIWVVSIASSLPPLFNRFNRFTLDPSKTSCTLDYLSSNTNFKLFILVIYIVYWILPGTIITICYIFIIMTFKRSSKSLTQVCSSSALLRVSSEPPSRSETSSVAINESGGGLGAQTYPRSLMATLSFRSRCLRRDRLRDSIRFSNFLGYLRRASTTRLARDVPSEQHSSEAMRTSVGAIPDDDRIVAAISDRVGINDGHPKRIIRRVASVYQHRLARMISPQSSSDHALERIELAYITRAQAKGSSNEPKVMAGLDGGRTGYARDATILLTGGQTVPTTEPNNQRLKSGSRVAPTTRSNRDLNEPAVPKRYSKKFAALAGVAPVVGLAPPGDRRISMDATGLAQADGFAAEMANRRLPPLVQGPLSHHHCCLVDSSNATINSEPNPSLTRQAAASSQGRGVKLTIISKVVSQLNRSDGGSSRSLKGPPPPQQMQRSRAICAPPESTCHFGNSSSQLSRASMQIRLAKMSFYLILLWMISWTPIASLALINLIAKCHFRANALAVFLANTMTKLGPTFDVFIYGISHPKIKKKFTQIIKRLLLLDNGRIGNGGNSKNNTTVANFNTTMTSQRLIHRTMTLNEDKLSVRAARGNCGATRGRF